jgi:glycosyltransferase involved in cell wall biosynthesis
VRNKRSDCIVIIPTHKDTMTPEEERSFRNTLDILGNWDIALVIPEGVSSDCYREISSKEKLQFNIITGRSGWMGSVERYNDMGLSPEFYRLFKGYKYVLICHLDAWVFRDELQMWIDKGYDYIGAPWFLLRGESYVPLERLMCPQGGNGGFSLRKVDKMIEITSNPMNSFNLILFFKGVFFLIKNKKFKFLKIFIRICREFLHDPDSFRKKYNVYEDVMFCIFYSLVNKRFRVAPAREEMYFATEVYSEEILKTKLKWQLPFAIHGYEKYLPSITSIDEYRNDINRDCYTKNMKRYGHNEKKNNNALPLVTVVTATYNLIQAGRAETFRQCMESVHGQTYKNIEHIIIDGASSDGTLELIQEYVDKGWGVCFSEPDEGLWDALYKGHQRANGQFVNYMNSDDYFCRIDSIEIAVKSLIKRNADWFFSEGMIVREDGTAYPFPTSLYGIFSCLGILHQSIFVRTDLLRAINPFRSRHITRENYLMILLCINRIKYAYSRDFLVHYREGGMSLKTYGGENLPNTRYDFGKYLYDSIGQFWGMTEDECLSMFTWECFWKNGVRYSLRLSKKLRIRGLRFAFRKNLAKYVYRNFGSLLSRRLTLLRGLLNRLFRIGSNFLKSNIK